MNELPTFTASTYGTSTAVDTTAMWNVNQAAGIFIPTITAPVVRGVNVAKAVANGDEFWRKAMAEVKQARRLVRVIIIDSAETLPLDQAVIYKGDEILTDLNDQELFFEIPINDLLKKHNVDRVNFPEKKGSKEKLDPARIRDLKMNVVTIATF